MQHEEAHGTLFDTYCDTVVVNEKGARRLGKHELKLFILA
jgi:hypothetical protein